MNEVKTDNRTDFLTICRGVMANPRKFWSEESREEEDVFVLYKRFGLLIICIPIFFGLLGHALADKLSSSVLKSSLIGLMISLCMSYAISWLMHWLSPKFGGEKNLTGALKVNLYSLVPQAFMSLTGLFGLGGVAFALQLIGGIWSIVITYLGVPKMLGIPKEQLLPFILTIWLVMAIISVSFGVVIQ